MKTNNFSTGFTLIELLVVITIMIIFMGISIPRYNTYTEQLKLKNQAKKIADVIELAKKKAISADLFQACSNFQGYQIVVNTDNFLLNFNCGGTYTNVQTYSMTKNIKATVGGTFDFLPLGTNTNLTIPTLTLKNSNINQCIDITISPIGIVSINETLTPCL